MGLKNSDQKARRLVGILLISFLLFVSSAWVVFDELFAPLEEDMQTVTVPNFEGQVAEKIEVADCFDVVTEYRYDASTPAGVVLAQTPGGGSQRKISPDRPTCKLTLTVSLGAETVNLPDVVGQDVRVAENTLRNVGFAVKTEVSTGAYPEGMVFDMKPTGNQILPVGSHITLFVSAGTPAVTVTVPDLRGLSRGDALTRLWLSQLSVLEVVEEPSDEDAGIVIRQNYQPGTVVMAGTKLTLYVSKND